MNALVLYLGNKNYSSWSMRAWLSAKVCGQPFDEVLIHLDRPDTRESILRASPSGRVPALRHKDVVVWDSLAITEYLAETFPSSPLWPRDVHARAVARAISAEMHSSFMALRNNMSMNIRLRAPNRGRAEGVEQDVERIVSIWRDTRARFAKNGPFLFGEAFTAADAFYAPVVTRFVTYDVSIPDDAQRYVKASLAHPFVSEWVKAAREEQATIPKYDR